MDFVRCADFVQMWEAAIYNILQAICPQCYRGGGGSCSRHRDLVLHAMSNDSIARASSAVALLVIK